jgi:hypothetical protein
MGFQKSYGRTGIVIPVKKVPQERKTQESGGFLQESRNLALSVNRSMQYILKVLQIVKGIQPYVMPLPLRCHCLALHV